MDYYRKSGCFSLPLHCCFLFRIHVALLTVHTILHSSASVEISSNLNITTQFISSDVLTIGMENRIVVHNSINLTDIRMGLVIESQTDDKMNCLHMYLIEEFTIHHNYTDDYISIGFHLSPAHSFLTQNTNVSLYIAEYNTTLFHRHVTVQLMQIQLWSSSDVYVHGETVSMWIYASGRDTRPVPNTTVDLRLVTSDGQIVQILSSSTNELGISSEDITLPSDNSDYTDKHYTIEAVHKPSGLVLTSKSIKVVKEKHRRQLIVDVSSEGYSYLWSGMTISVSVKRPGFNSFEGQISIKSCIMNRHQVLQGTCLNQKPVSKSQKNFIIDLSQSDISIDSKVKVIVTALEHMTGIVEEHVHSLDIFPNHLTVDLTNVPTKYRPGEILSIPILVTSTAGSVEEVSVRVTLTSSEGVKLIDNDFYTNVYGEVIVTLSVSPYLAGDLKLVVLESGSRLNLAEATIVTVIGTEPAGIRLVNSSYTYSAGDLVVFQVSTSCNGLLITSSADGAILTTAPLSYPTTILTITEDMTPHIIVTIIPNSLQTDNQVFSFQITNPIKAHISSQSLDDGMLLPGDSVLTHFRDNIMSSLYHDSVYLVSIDNSLYNAYSTLSLLHYNRTVKHSIKVSNRLIKNFPPVCTKSDIREGKLNDESQSLQQTNLNAAKDKTVGRRPNNRELATPLSTSETQQNSISSRDSDSSIPRDEFITTESYIDNLHRLFMSSSMTDELSSLESHTTESPFFISSGAIETLQQSFEDGTSAEDNQRLKPRKRKQYHRVSRRRDREASRVRRQTGSRCDMIHQSTIELTESGTSTFMIPRCLSDTTARVKLPSYGPSSWLITGVLISSKYGVLNLNRLKLMSQKQVYLSSKAPPKDLQEAEQFQLQLNVISHVSSAVQCHVRLILHNEEAFCFKNLIINSYPHVNLTVTTSEPINVASFVATALRRGTYRIVSELWINETMTHSLDFDITVSPIAISRQHFRERSSDVSTRSPAGRRFSNLQLKMRYEQTSNQHRCKGFRLKVDQSVIQETKHSYEFDSLFRGKRSAPISNHRISGLPKYSLKVCYRILKKSSQGAYYIDVESYPGYKALNSRVEPNSGNCGLTEKDIVPYENGRVITVDSSNMYNESWCCVTIDLEAIVSGGREEQSHSQMNQSASIRMTDGSSPNDFCLEFYNLKSQSPYSNHICSQHGCLCTENTLGSCKQIRRRKTSKATRMLATMYLEASYVLRVNVTGATTLDEDGYTVEEAIVLQSYSQTYLATGQKIHLYFKEQRKSCSMIRLGSVFLIMGRQSHIHHGDVASIYLDNQVSMLSYDDIEKREDSEHFMCFLDHLLCPASSFEVSNSSYVPNWDDHQIKRLSKAINKMCRKGYKLEELGIQTTALPYMEETHSCSQAYYQTLYKQKHYIDRLYKRETRDRQQNL